MIEGRTVLAVIPARGGSKGLSGKNLRKLGGRSLLDWTIAAARKSSVVDRVVLSSDDEEILALGATLGCDSVVRRPADLATDTARTIHVIHHVVTTVETGWEYVVQLQPTSPFRSPEDIDGAVHLCVGRGAPACVSVGPSATSPHWIFSLAEDQRLRPILPVPKDRSRRQDMPDYFELNGAVYVARTDWITERDSFLSEETVAYVMPRDRSLDVDTAVDLALAEVMLGPPRT